VSAYAGWGGSLPADVAAQRRRQAFAPAELSPEEFVGTLLPTRFSEATPQESVDAFEASMRAPRPVAEDLHASIPGSGLVVLPDAGHVCDIEVPEAFTDTLRGFLRDQDG
jgi:hypothetical protein